jgi:integrase
MVVSRVGGFSDLTLSERRSLSRRHGISISDFVLHDLRRTAATAMARLNIPPHVVDRLLNHVSGQIRGVAAVYNRHAYTDERKAALDAWARHLESLIKPQPQTATVVPIAAGRR